MLILVYFELGKASEDLAQALRVSVSSKEFSIRLHRAWVRPPQALARLRRPLADPLGSEQGSQPLSRGPWLGVRGHHLDARVFLQKIVMGIFTCNYCSSWVSGCLVKCFFFLQFQVIFAIQKPQLHFNKCPDAPINPFRRFYSLKQLLLALRCMKNK